MVKRKKRAVRSIKLDKSFSIRKAKLGAYAFGQAVGILSVLTLLLYAVMTWFSSFDGSIISQQYPIGFSFSSWTIIIGLVQTYVLGYIGGWIFVKIYNRFVR